MSHSAEPALQNPFRYPSNAVANIDSELTRAENQPNMVVDGAGQLTTNDESGLRARRVSRREMQPPNLLNLSIPAVPNIPIFGQAIATPAHQPSPEETSIEGEQLFVNFIHQEVINEGLEAPMTSSFPPETGGADAESQGPDSHFQRQGRMLRQIADEFARSKERRRVQVQANSVDLENIRQQDFLQLLGGLFTDGADARNITFERIVVLFFFIRDLAVRAIRQKINSCFIRFMEWSVSFIRQHVCLWVQQHGGWEAVLQYVFTKKLLVKAGLVLVVVGATLTIAGAIMYWQKST